MTKSQTILPTGTTACRQRRECGYPRRVGILNDLAWALSDTDMQRAYALSETAYALADSPHDGAPPYQAGIA